MTNEALPRLEISYGVEQEVRRVQNTLERLPWYLKEGYRVGLPNGITKDSSGEEVMRAVKHEYVATDYAESASTIRREWEALSQGFGKMRGESAFHLGDEYNVVLTKYGVGGSYNPDLNQVIVKVSARPQGGTAGIVAHEVVHMTIQYFIDLYHVSHWRKERLVDLLMEHYFPGLKKRQVIKEDVSMVDRAFEKLFPNIEAIAQFVGN